MFFLLISYVIIAHHVSFASSSAGTTKRTSTEAEEEAPIDKQREGKASEEDSDEESDEDSEGGSGEEKEEQDLEETTEEVVGDEMAAMSLSSATATMKLPALVYTWTKDRQEHCSVDILLLSGTTEDQIECKIGKGGKSITIFYKLAKCFLSSVRLIASTGGRVGQNHSKTASLNKAINDFHASFDFDDPVLQFKIKLPMKVDNSCVCEIAWYRNDDDNPDAQYYYMLHVEMIGSEKPRQFKSPITKRIVDMNAVDEAEDDHDWTMRGGSAGNVSL